MTSTKQEREHLQALMELAAAKSATNKTIKSLNDLAGVGDDDIRKLGDGIRARLDHEDAQIEMGSTRLQDQMDDVLEKGAVDTQLDERRKRLGLGGNTGSTPS